MKKYLFILFTLFFSVGSIFAKNVQVSVTPTNATVIQKGKVIQPVTPGLYSITIVMVEQAFTVQADGYDTEQFIVNLKTPGAIQINLTPNRKDVSIISNPSTADIYVDGRLMGQSPVNFTINKGESRSIILSADGYERYTKTIHFTDQADTQMSYNIEMVQNRKDINVTVDAPSVEFIVDGIQVAKGKNDATFQVYKNRAVQLVIRAEGYLEYTRLINFNDEISPNLTKDLAVDQAYTASEPGTDQANKPFQVMIKKSMSRDDAIQRMKYYISELFETLEINDNVAGWYRTAWNVEQYPDKIIRSRIELKEVPDNGDGQLKYKMLLQSQISYKTSGAKDEDFHAWDRVLKKYVKLLTDIRYLIADE